MISQAVAVPLPVTVLMVANGVVFGVWGGMLVSFVGGFAGSVVAYGLGHHFGRGVAEGIVPRAALDAADRVMKRRGGWAVVLGRWVPGIPCDPLSYAAGITRMPLVPFLVLTVVGLIPANLVTAYLGAEATTDVKTSYWLLGIAGVAALWGAWTLFKRHRKRAEMRKADAA
jgi:uncharacterized membrane protein YdjX (TVP38/TMEM64 family)